VTYDERLADAAGGTACRDQSVLIATPPQPGALWHHGDTMRVADLLEAHRPNFSFEFFPPKDDDGVAALFATIAALRELEPGFVSVTCGAAAAPGRDARAGGAHPSRAGDHTGRPRDLRGQQPGRAARHPAAVGRRRIDNVLALRGDPRGDRALRPEPGGLATGRTWSRS